ncbi:MAG: LamG domain-containing protein, partial [Verrucomicrobiota bacterium]
MPPRSSYPESGSRRSTTCGIFSGNLFIVRQFLHFTLTLMSAFAGISAIAEEPRLVLKLDFEGEAWKEHRSEGPRSPQFEDFDPGNLSRKFGSKSSWVERADSEDLRFGIGDTITMECWVKVESINDGAMAYLIGKGRHPRQEGGTGQTQNYAMRLKGSGSGAKLGFLFSSEREGPNSSRDWHRWESTRLVPKQGWHHVAIRYTFGDEESLIAYIDGRATEGTWDMGGATDRAPVETEEALMIGTGHVRGGAETFRGWLDEVRIWRGALSDEILKDRFTFAPPPTQLTEAMVPPGEVLMQISEKGVPVQVGWPEYPIVTETYRERAFGIFELPHRYVGTGVRGDRANPTHLRLAAHVVFPEGTHRL